jgi:putative oxidoreductase
MIELTEMIEEHAVPCAALLLRLTLSMFFIAHLYRKYFGMGYDVWFNGWIKAGYPAWTLHYTVAAEFAGAVLLLLGAYTRYVAVFALPVMIAVTLQMAAHRGFWFSNGGAEFPLAWCVMLVALALLGDGAFALKVPPLPPLPWKRFVARPRRGDQRP